MSNEKNSALDFTARAYGFYGYIRDPDDRHKLIIDEPAAEIVRLIFDLREKGLTTTQIARKLNADGVQTASERKKLQGSKRDWIRNGKERMWDASVVALFLRDERYTGKHIYGKKRRVELGKLKSEPVPPSEWIVVHNAYEAIISEEQFARVQKPKPAETPKKQSKQKAIFSRRIYCGGCGLALNRSGAGTYYCDTPKTKPGLGCVQGRISEKAVVQTVLSVVHQQAQIADNAKTLQTAGAKSSFSELTTLRGEVQSLKRLIEKVNSAKLSLWEKHFAKTVSDEAYQRESEKLTGQITAYTDKIYELEAQIRKAESDVGQENAFVERFSKQVGIKTLTHEVVDEFVKAIHVHTIDRIEITLNYADEYQQVLEQMGD